jgi:hypothetical protein
VTIQDLVSPFVEFAADDLGDDIVTRWRDRVVEPHSHIYRAVETWLNPADAQGSLPALVHRRADLVLRARRAIETVREAQTLLRQALPDAGRIDAVVLVGLGKSVGAAFDSTEYRAGLSMSEPASVNRHRWSSRE